MSDRVTAAPRSGVLPEPFWASVDGRLVIYHGRAEDVLPTLEADVVVTDPPYGTGCAPRGGVHAGTIDTDSEQWPEWDSFDPSWLRLWPGPAAVFCGIRYVFRLAAEMEADGLLIYAKTNPNPMGSSYEPCVTRGFKAPRGRQHLNAYNAFNGQVHPTQKPLEVMAWIVGAAPTGVVVDPFMGSGTTLAAAQSLGRCAIGIEIEERYCEIAARRLEDPPLIAAMRAEQIDLFCASGAS
jgi:DNA modification methylase